MAKGSMNDRRDARLLAEIIVDDFDQTPDRKEKIQTLLEEATKEADKFAWRHKRLIEAIAKALYREKTLDREGIDKVVAEVRAKPPSAQPVV